MMVLSPSAVELLTDLAEHGFDLQALGEALGYRPRSAMTPDLLQRLREHKAELMRWMDMAELRRSVSQLWADQAWLSAWERRFEAAEYANLDSLRRVLEMILGQVEEHHRRGDWLTFASARKDLDRLASGEIWDGAALTAADLPSDWGAW